MISEQSFGVIPLKIDHEEPKVLLIEDLHGNWGFPKGHPEKGELPIESAERELKEEIGLSPTRWLSKDPYPSHYRYTRKGLIIQKSVLYYPALVSGKEKIQKSEIRSYKWLTFNEAISHCTFDELKGLIKQVQEEWKAFF